MPHLGSFIPSPHATHATLETAICAALESGAIDHETANAMFAATWPHCAAHQRPALVICKDVPCCEQCVRDRRR